eukprot:scaffold11925_cov101-Isochrysis_galbana.AAC.3
MENDKMIICEGPSGCKKYLPNLALDLKVPRCICHLKSSAQAENAAKSKVARKSATTLAKSPRPMASPHSTLSLASTRPAPKVGVG